jgi:hypothetical protein
MPDWKVFYRDDRHRDAQSIHTSKEAAIVTSAKFRAPPTLPNTDN